jgi:N-acetylglucosaminyldiphosphoundecaprenol N-acetyl-beta-D-mannosaminyltransferase
MLMEAYWNRHFAKVLQKADIVSPDGMPLVWMLRLMGIHNQDRVAGMDVFVNLCRLASINNVRVFFLGSTPEVLNSMKNKLQQEFPLLSIAGTEALPFRPLTTEEDKALVEKIDSSNAGLVFVCLGCPKQENWIAEHKDKINGVMIGVGAVFAVYAGLQKRAPSIIRQLGLEWLYRLIQEPRRLWKRYGTTIPPFVYLAIKQLLSPYKNKLEVKQGLTKESDILDLEAIDTMSSSKIGEILVKQNVLTWELLEKALIEQEQKPEMKIGEILIKNNFLSLEQLKYYLKNQSIKLGEILIEVNLISPVELKKMLSYQATHGGLLGEILIKRKIITTQELKCLLIEQYSRKNSGMCFTDKELL